MGKMKSAAGGPGEAHGYLTSALVFAAITGLWAVIVRNDPYYRLVDFFGARVPATMIAYLVLMPLAGMLVGRWRYDGRHIGGAAGFAGKLFARFIHFTYVHLLIVLFTVAMATDYFFNLNIDAQIRSIDDRMFDLAARFAPWLAAYLTGFNLGRAMRRGPEVASVAVSNAMAFDGAESESPPPKRKTANGRNSKRMAPLIEKPAFTPSENAELGDLSINQEPEISLTSSGLPAANGAVADDQPGFLPPQDFSKLRPGLRELR